MTDQAAPRPWFAFNDGRCIGGPCLGIPGQPTAGIAICDIRLRTEAESRANVALILKSVNSHDALATALHGMLAVQYADEAKVQAARDAAIRALVDAGAWQKAPPT